MKISPLVLHVTHTVGGLTGEGLSPFVIILGGGGRQTMASRVQVKRRKLPKYNFALPMIELAVTSEA